MDSRLKETLSAMMDDEADELAVHRVLAHCHDPELRAQWQRWYQQRSLIHEHRQGHQSLSVDVSAAVRSAISDTSEPGVAGQQPETSSPSRRSARGWSAAAAVSLALLVGFGAGSQWQTTDGSYAAKSRVASSPSAQPDSDEKPVSEVAIQKLDREQWNQMSHYLLEHAQHSNVGISNGSMGYARVASVSGGVH